MLKDARAFSSYSVNDLDQAKKFYGEVLGLECADGAMDFLEVDLGGGCHVMLYPKGEDHKPASFTVLNFPVKDIEQEVDELTKKGVEFIQYNIESGGFAIKTDERGIMKGKEDEPTMAWFADPAGNILALMQL